MKNQSKYIDAFVLVIAKSKVPAYKKMAKEGAEAWMKHGALRYRECMGDDLNPDTGGQEFLPFAKLVKLKPTETIWFSYIEYKSKKHRDQVNAKVMKEMGEKYKDDPTAMKDMPFDMKKMSFGGFKIEVGY